MKTPHLTFGLHRFLPSLGTALALVTTAEASSRHFAYSYESTTMAKGAMELENWVTWKTNKANDPDFERFDMRHEFEYGVTDRLQLALYFFDWRYEKSSSDDSYSYSFHDVAIEAIYNITDPNRCPFGSALYGEIKGSDDLIELEAKLLLQKNYGSWMFVYNLGLEVEWEDDYSERNGELVQTAGVSYQINPTWSVGAEALYEIAVPDVKEFGDNGAYLGPNATWRNDRFSIALAGLWQLTSLSGEPDFQLRTIFAIDF